MKRRFKMKQSSASTFPRPLSPNKHTTWSGPSSLDIYSTDANNDSTAYNNYPFPSQATGPVRRSTTTRARAIRMLQRHASLSSIISEHEKDNEEDGNEDDEENWVDYWTESLDSYSENNDSISLDHRQSQSIGQEEVPSLSSNSRKSWAIEVI
jgi:hypothetical protein